MKLFTFSADLIFDHDLKFAKMLLTNRNCSTNNVLIEFIEFFINFSILCSHHTKTATKMANTVVKYIPVLVHLYLYVLLYPKFVRDINRYKLWLRKSFFSPFLVFTVSDE
jgi:hypothetical protein